MSDWIKLMLFMCVLQVPCLSLAGPLFLLHALPATPLLSTHPTLTQCLLCWHVWTVILVVRSSFLFLFSTHSHSVHLSNLHFQSLRTHISYIRVAHFIFLQYLLQSLASSFTFFLCLHVPCSYILSLILCHYHPSSSP